MPLSITNREFVKFSGYHDKAAVLNTSSTILRMVGIITIAAAAILIDASGGPMCCALFYYGGIGLGSFAISEMVLATCMSMRAKNWENEMVDLPEFFDSALKKLTQKAAIQKFTTNLPEAVFKLFAEHVVASIFRENRKEKTLTDHEKIVIASLAAHKEFAYIERSLFLDSVFLECFSQNADLISELPEDSFLIFAYLAITAIYAENRKEKTLTDQEKTVLARLEEHNFDTL